MKVLMRANVAVVNIVDAVANSEDALSTEEVVGVKGLFAAASIEAVAENPERAIMLNSEATAVESIEATEVLENIADVENTEVV